MADDASHDFPAEKQTPSLDEKVDYKADVESTDRSSDEFRVLENERDIATHVISTEDDPSLSPWTIRAFIIGIGLSAFGGVLGTIRSRLPFSNSRWQES